MIKNKKMHRFLDIWGPVVLWAVVIFLFSSQPTTKALEIDWQDFIIKKTAHIVEFGTFSALIYRAFKMLKKDNEQSGIYAIALSIIYGATDEFHQSFTPGREPTVRDVIFDTIGAILAIYIIWNLLPKAPKKLKRLAKKLQILS